MSNIVETVHEDLTYRVTYGAYLTVEVINKETGAAWKSTVTTCSRTLFNVIRDHILTNNIAKGFRFPTKAESSWDDWLTWKIAVPQIDGTVVLEQVHMRSTRYDI